jgi:hypothetical protein
VGLTFRRFGEQIQVRAPIACGQHLEQQRPRARITGSITKEAQHVLQKNDR